MSFPDYVAFSVGSTIPLRYEGFPHGLALLPHGITIADVGDPGHRFAGVFLIDPDCAGMALNDSSLDHYIRAKKPIFLFAVRARDLRPFLKRADGFRRRGVTVEAIP